MSENKTKKCEFVEDKVSILQFTLPVVDVIRKLLRKLREKCAGFGSVVRRT